MRDGNRTWTEQDGATDENLGALVVNVPFEEVVSARLRPVVELLEVNGTSYGIYREVISQVERALIRLALERTEGNQRTAAQLLGISRNTLRAKRETLGINGSERA